MVGKNQEVQMTARIVNHGSRRYDNLKVNLEIDGKHISRNLVSLRPEESVVVAFPYIFGEEGSHCVTVGVETPLPLKVDDTMSCSIDVEEELPVLVVNGAPSQEPLKGETDFLVLALDPSGEEGEGLVRKRVVEAQQIGEVDLTDFKVLILANVEGISSEVAEELKSFVEGGGGILLFLGDKVNTHAYNEILYRGGDGLLPAKLGGQARSEREKAAVVEQRAEFIRIQAAPYGHPALEVFSSQEGMAMERAHIYQWYELKVEKRQRSESVQVFPMATYENSTPFLLERIFPRGSVILCSTACDTDWSDLPLRPFYLPLIQQLVGYLAQRGATPKNLRIGDNVVELLSEVPEGNTATLIRPGGVEEITITRDSEGARIVLRNLRNPGLYTLLLPEGKKVYYVVYTDRRESDLKVVAPEVLSKISQDFSLPVSKSWTSLRRDTHRWESSGEIWKIVLFGVLGLLFLELYLQQKFYM